MDCPDWVTRMISQLPPVSFTHPNSSSSVRLVAINPLGRTDLKADSLTRLILPRFVTMLKHSALSKLGTTTIAVTLSRCQVDQVDDWDALGRAG